MELPTDSPPPPPQTNAVDLIASDPAPPPITSAEREQDFNRVFGWHGKEIALTLASELYYRDFRTLCNAPALESFETIGDFAAEGCRVIYCAHLDARQCRALRLLEPWAQIKVFDEWVEKHIGLHELTKAAELAREINAAITRARSTPHETGEDEIQGMGN